MEKSLLILVGLFLILPSVSFAQTVATSTDIIVIDATSTIPFGEPSFAQPDEPTFFAPLMRALSLPMSSLSLPADTIFSDDFNDNSIDSTKWTTSGSNVREQNGEMDVSTDAADRGGILNSSWVPVNGTHPITVSRRTMQRAGNSYYNGFFRLYFDTNGDGVTDKHFGVDYANNSYSGYYGTYCSRHGFFLDDGFNGQNGIYCGVHISNIIPAIWNTWFTESLTYDPVSGLLTYSINGTQRAELNVGSLPVSTNYQMQVLDRPWGWYTGHFSHFDDLVVTQQADTKNINVAFVLAEPVGVTHTSTSITAQPCKLIEEKTYQNGYSRENPSQENHYTQGYYTDLTYCINDYYKEVSHGSLSFTFTIFDKGGDWYKITDPAKTEAYYGANDLEDEFVKDALVEFSQDLSTFDMVAVVHAGKSYQASSTIPKSNLYTQSWTPFGTLFENKPYKFIIAEQDTVGPWVHEAGHVVGVLMEKGKTMTPDLYKMGNVEKWDLMADGEWNGGPFDILSFLGDGSNPTLMSSYTQEFLGWLKEDIHPKSASSTAWINSLETSNLGDSIFRYNLENNTSSSTGQYYILEARNRNLSTWDESLPEDKALVLYRVDASGSTEKYGYENESISNEKWMISIPAGVLHTGVNDGVLSASGETYRDLDNMIKISTEGDRTVNGKYEIAASIQEIPEDSILGRVNGMVFRPANSILKRIQSNDVRLSVRGFTGPQVFIGELKVNFIKDTSFFPVLFLVISLVLFFVYKKKNIKNSTNHKVAKFFMWLTWIASVLVWVVYIIYSVLIFAGALHYIPQALDPACGKVRTAENPDPCAGRNVYASIFDSSSPDLDLHAITPDGKHIGMNYLTGEYENQISGSIVSGDNQGIPEWIYVPEGTQVKYYVSAHDNNEFLKQNPQIASAMATTTDSYSLYARTIDPTVGIFTSPILENQTIAPAEEKTYQIPTTGEDVSLEEVKDFTAPMTTATPVGILGTNGYYTSVVTIDLTVTDPTVPNEEPSGVATTKYSLDNGATWNTYSTSTPLIIATEGATTLQYHSVDNSGNSETIKTLALNIDTTAPTIFASDTSAEQLTPSGTSLVITATAEDNLDTNPTLVSNIPLS